MYNCTKDIWETFQFVLLDAIGITFAELPVSCLILIFEVSPNHLCVVFNFSSDWCEGKSIQFGIWQLKKQLISLLDLFPCRSPVLPHFEGLRACHRHFNMMFKHLSATEVVKFIWNDQQQGAICLNTFQPITGPKILVLVHCQWQAKCAVPAGLWNPRASFHRQMWASWNSSHYPA